MDSSAHTYTCVYITFFIVMFQDVMFASIVAEKWVDLLLLLLHIINN